MQPIAVYDESAGDYFCPACFRQAHRPVPVWDDTVDTVATCAHCGAVIPFTLTETGVRELRRALIRRWRAGHRLTTYLADALYTYGEQLSPFWRQKARGF